jgi:hypothetical protein
MIHKQQTLDQTLSFGKIEHLLRLRTEYAEQSPGLPLLVTIIDPRCETCEAQLEAFEYHLTRFYSVHLIFAVLSADTTIQWIADRYPALKRSPNVTWGTLDEKTARNQLGVHKTPSILLFDESRHLYWRFSGEIRCESIFELIEDFMISDL